MELLVLAGGFGTRLRSAVRDVPKVLAPVNGVPFLKFQLENWLEQGVREFHFLLHHQAEQVIAFIEFERNDLLSSCHVDWVIESSPLDTGGAIANAVDELGIRGEFLVTNADTWLGGGMADLYATPSPAMAVTHLNDTERYGQVQFDEDGFVTKFVEKGRTESGGWINAGLFHLNAELFYKWDGKAFSLERDLFTALVKRRGFRAVTLDTEFTDIGVPEDYQRFCAWVESGRSTKL